MHSDGYKTYSNFEEQALLRREPYEEGYKYDITSHIPDAREFNSEAEAEKGIQELKDSKSFIGWYIQVISLYTI